jgi:catechol 2,3-dioxygenase-like lactoylglutathione lyase family enzyme
LNYNFGRVLVIAGIHHIKLPVSDVRRSRAWYERVLGFEVVIEFVEDDELMGVALRREGCPPQIALRQDPARARALSGFDAVALLVPTRDDVRHWEAALDRMGETHGGLVTGHKGGTVLVGLHDPDGIEIRLYAD